MIYDAIIIGGGASGYACAISAVRRGKKVLMLDANPSPLKKVMISGGGRCNFTNLNVSVENYISSDSDFCKTALESFSSKDFLRLLKENKLGYITKNKTQLFCKEGSAGIIRMLENEAKAAEKKFRVEILEINKENGFDIKTNQGSFRANNLVIATGGMSFPQLGASDFGYKIAKQFGLKVVPVRPALAAYNLEIDILKKISKLKGISCRVELKCNNFRTTDDILFTHFGLSGPGILQSSIYWNNGDTININFMPDINFSELLKEKRETSRGIKISSILGKSFPASMVEFFMDGEKDVFATEVSNKMIAKIAKNINDWEVKPSSTRGFKAAEVTLGGVDVKEINPQTMESKESKGLYFIGEVLDVTGQLGGYNLQWAWSSGWLAGMSI